MFKIPKKVSDRFAENLKKYQRLAISQKDRDVSEADTVTLVKDILADVFGYDKWTELTGEQQVRGTFCDLAVKIDGKIKYLVEVKAAGVELNDTHLRQARNYAANQSCGWVVLTNVINWRLYRLSLGQPIDLDLVSSFELPSLSLKSEEDQDKMFLLCREGVISATMDLYRQHTQLLNKYTVAQVVMSDPVVAIIRRKLRRLFPELRVDREQISDILINDVVKREVIDGEKVKEAQRMIKKAAAVAAKLTRQAEKKQSETHANQQETSEPQ